jgi:hypothetical protein
MMDKIEPYGIPLRKPNPDSSLGKELYEYMNGVLRAYSGAHLMVLLCGGTEVQAERAGDEAAQLVKDEWDFDALWERVENLLTEE